MNIAQAKQIPLRVFVEHLGGRFSHNGRDGELWYYSPFRPDERTASFKINEKTNQWHDFARTEKLDAHGDILDLWTDFYSKPRRDSDAIKQALQALKTFASTCVQQVNQSPSNNFAKPNPSPRYHLLKPPTRIWQQSLKNELARRCLTLATVQPLLKQAHILDTATKKTYYGFAFENDKGGYELSIPNPKRGECFKTTSGSKWITTIQGSDTTVQLYEGFFDFFTSVQMEGYNTHTHIVLNSVSNIRLAAQWIVERKYFLQSVFSFMDNDPAGERATHKLAEMIEPSGLTFGTMNHIYEGYKDLNDYWRYKHHAHPENEQKSGRHLPKHAL